MPSSRSLRILRLQLGMAVLLLWPGGALSTQADSEWPGHPAPAPAIHRLGSPVEPPDSTDAGSLYLAPFAGMAVSAAPGYTAQVFGFHFQHDLGGRVSVDGWAGGSREGGDLKGALGLDLRGGISSRRGPGRTGTRPFILASASIVIFARPRI